VDATEVVAPTTAMSATATTNARARRILLGVIGAVAVAAVLLWLAAGVVSSGEAASHAQLHAVSALAMLGIGGAIVARWGRAGLIAFAPAIGFTLFATAQVVEGLGALGYAPDNETPESGLADLHDVGLALTGPVLVALFAGIAISLGLVVARRTARRWAGVAVGFAIFVPGLLLVKISVGGL